MRLAGLWFAAFAAAGQIPTESWPPHPPVIPSDVKVVKGVAYGPHPKNVLDILTPGGAPRDARPGAIVIHGGGWIGGSRDWVAELVCLRFIEKGFVVANVEYQVAKDAKAPAAVDDVLRAARWFLENTPKFGVDPSRVVVTGDSAGGHLALMVGMWPETPPRVRAVVNFFGITDVNDQLAGSNRRPSTVQWVPEQEGRDELAQRMSPLMYARAGLPPILTIHGTADPSVPYEHAVKLTKAIQSAGGTAILVTVEGGGHGFPKAQTDEIYEREVWPFLKKTGVLTR
jgi:acetyl esterase/lipase